MKALVGVGNPVLWTAFLAAMFSAVHRFIQSRSPRKESFFPVFLIIYVPLYFLMWRRQGYLYYMLPAVFPMAFMVWQMMRFVRSKVVKAGFFSLVFLATVLLSPMLTYEPVPHKWYQWVARIMELEG